jgi:hypothetical protein
MKKIAILTLLTSAMLPMAASAQERANTVSLADARSQFAAMDVDNNLALSPREAQAGGVTRAQATFYDFNKDGKLSRTEFIMAFKALAEARGSLIARDLASKVSGIQENRRETAKQDLAKREAEKKRLESAEAKKIAEARAAAKKRRQLAEAARKRAEAEKKDRRKDESKPLRRRIG